VHVAKWRTIARRAKESLPAAPLDPRSLSAPRVRVGNVDVDDLPGGYLPANLRKELRHRVGKGVPLGPSYLRVLSQARSLRPGRFQVCSNCGWIPSTMVTSSLVSFDFALAVSANSRRARGRPHPRVPPGAMTEPRRRGGPWRAAAEVVEDWTSFCGNSVRPFARRATALASDCACGVEVSLHTHVAAKNVMAHHGARET